MNLSIIPDRLAHYRYPVFRDISRFLEQHGIDKIYVYAPVKKDNSGIEIPPLEYIGDDISKGGIRWRESKNFFIKNRIIWQTASLRCVFDKNINFIILWGDANVISNWLVLLICRIIDKKVLLWTHGIYGNENKFKLKIRTSFYKLSSGLLLYGERSKKDLEKIGFCKEKCFVINNSLDVFEQDLLYEKNINGIRKETESLKILFVGRLTKQKKINLIIEALPKIAVLTRKEVSITIVGEGEEKESLANLAKEKGISESVFFEGSCHDEASLAIYFMNANVVVSPGNVGLTAMHSLVYGTPVITHDDFSNQMPEYEAIVEGFSGVFYKAFNFDSLAYSVIRCDEMIDNNIINDENCRSIIFDKYNTKYQSEVIIESINNTLGDVPRNEK